MWEFIEKFVYINLDHREDRREIMRVFFEKGNVPQDKIIRFSAIKDNPGIIGAAKSHIAVIKMAKENNWKNVLILEDDLTWVNFEESYKKLESLINNEEWDVCLLGGDYIKTVPPNRVNISLHTSAYIVKLHYYDKLLNNYETGLRKKLELAPIYMNLPFNKMNKVNFLKNNTLYFNIDVYWSKLQLKDNWIGIIEPMCVQVDSYSDNANTNKFQEKKIVYNPEWFRYMEITFINDLL